MSGFSKWFVAQFGMRETDPEQTDRDLVKRVLAGQAASAELALRQEWDARHEAALYVWQITDEAKRDWSKGKP